MEKLDNSLESPITFLSSVLKALNIQSSLKEKFIAILDIFKADLGIANSAIYISDESGELACFTSTTEKIQEWKRENAIIKQIYNSRENLIIPDLSKSEAYSDELAPWIDIDGRDMSFLGVPIIAEDDTLGVIAVTLPYTSNEDLNTIVNLLVLVSSSLVQSIINPHSFDLERQQLLAENVVLKQKLQEEFSFHNLIGNSHEIRDVYEQVAQVARTNTTVLLRGESGTGKELIAEAIHYNSLRSDKPFIRVNCAAVPETLIESEFFGYEKGAFTGAVGRKAGRFELANKGTIFLDEVGELSTMTQVKLLRVLQDQSFERVGGTETLRVDVRLIAATNSDLESLMSQGKFRDDLYYRLNIFSIYMPPLRDRKTDILLLADHFLQKYSRQHAKAVKRISTPAIDMLMRYHWPGNVRELENCIERAVIVCEDHVLHSYHLPPSLQTAESSGTLPKLTLKESVLSYERELIQDALKSSRGNRARAARLLGTTERIIGYKIKNLGIDTSRFKP